MATLSIFKSKFIVVLKWAGMIFAALICLLVLFKIIFFVKEKIWPTPPTPPTVSFDILPPVFFPSGIKKNFNYEIDTLTGQLPNFPDRTKVYEMQKPKPDILAVDRASQKVAILDFNPKPEHLSDILYRWTSTDSPQRSLVLNVNMASFTLYSPYLTDPGVISGANLPGKDTAITEAVEFLEILGLYPEEIDPEKTSTEFFSINSGILQKTQNLREAKLISIYFFQKNIDELPIVYPLGPRSAMNLVVAGGSQSAQIVNARFFYQKVTDKSATYPIKTAEQAFDELKNGKAHIASHDGSNSKIIIKNIYLGFYSEGRQQEYLTPVVVFEGNDNFVAYIPAITSDWVSK